MLFWSFQSVSPIGFLSYCSTVLRLWSSLNFLMYYETLWCKIVNFFFRPLNQQIVLLLRLVPLLPFNVLNDLLSVTPVRPGEYVLASWVGMMPSTFGLVYVGTTLKDLSDVSHGWNEVSTVHQVFMALSFVVSVAKASLDKALAENGKMERIFAPSMLPIVADSSLDIEMSLLIRVDSSMEENYTQLLV